MDRFKVTLTPIDGAFPVPPIDVLMPSQVNARETLTVLRAAGLTVPRTSDVFWLNSKYLEVSDHTGMVIIRGEQING